MPRSIISISLPDELAEQLATYCALNERGKSWVLQHALREYLEDQIDGAVAAKRSRDKNKMIDSEEVYKTLGI